MIHANAVPPNLAIKTLHAWELACLSSSGNDRAWTDAEGRTYRLALDPQLDDGAIRGRVLRVEGDYERRAGSVLILPDGQIARAPRWLREVTP